MNFKYQKKTQAIQKQRPYTKDDLVKTKFLFRTLFLIAFVAILSLFYIWSRVQVVEYGYEINGLKAEQAELLENNQRIKLEVATLRAPQRIQEIAARELNMQLLKLEQIKKVHPKKFSKNELDDSQIN